MSRSANTIKHQESTKLVLCVLRIALYGVIVVSSLVFASFLNGYWDRLSLYVAGLFGIFFLSEVMVAISLGIPKPPSSPKKEHEPELAKPVIAPTIDLRDHNRSIAACLKRNDPNKRETRSPASLNSSLRHRIKSPQKPLNTAEDLEEYLQSFVGPDNKSTLIAPPKEVWQSPIRFSDYPNKFKFQLSKTPPSKPLNPLLPFDTSGAEETSTNAWIQLGVTNRELNNWQLNLRSHLWNCIVSPLSIEIERINRELKAVLPDVQIGKTSISDLQMVSNTHLSQDIRRVIPYLEVGSNHGYFVQRLRTLAQEGYLSSYIWNGGENYNGQKWSKQYPTDTAILIHIFSCWMDNHMPPDPSAGPDARAFSDRFILRAKSLVKQKEKMKINPNSKKKVAFPVSVRVPVSVVEFSEDPPEYYVQHLDQEKLKNNEIEYQIKEFPAGRYNPLQGILLLLYLLKKENYGEIAGVSLGPAGLNLLSVFNEK